MERDRVETLLGEAAAAWVDDPGSDVVYTEVLEGRRAVRVRQQARDFTTIWFEVGDRTLTVDAYVLPAPPHGREEVYRQCLFRSHGARRVHFALDRDGEIYLRGRLALDTVTPEVLEMVLAEVYETIEISFRPLIRAGFATE